MYNDVFFILKKTEIKTIFGWKEISYAVENHIPVYYFEISSGKFNTKNLFELFGNKIELIHLTVYVRNIRNDKRTLLFPKYRIAAIWDDKIGASRQFSLCGAPVFLKYGTTFEDCQQFLKEKNTDTAISETIIEKSTEAFMMDAPQERFLLQLRNTGDGFWIEA